MRVLLTTDTIGGVWTFTAELARELMMLGHAVALVSLGSVPSEEQLVWSRTMARRFGDSFRFAAAAVPLEWMSSNAEACSAATPLLLRLVDGFAPDVVHANQFCFGAIPISIPKLVTAHSDVLSWAEACRPAGLQPSPWLSHYCSLVQDGLDGADAVVAPTQWMLSALNRNFALPPEQETILNGRTLPRRLQKATRKQRAVSIGRLWDEGKNLALLTALDSPFPITVAGEWRHEGTQAEPAPPGITTLGQLCEDELLRLFATSSVYLVPSIYEPFGLAPLEAAQCGCAVLANDIDSLREVWGPAALYFHDAGSLEALLYTLNESPRLLVEARRRSQRRARQLSAARMTEQYLALYARMLSRAAGAEHGAAAHA